jgi:hypothetical protein
MAELEGLKQKIMELGLPDTWLAGTTQRVTGEVRQRFAEGYLALMTPEHRKDLEGQIEKLHGMKDPSRFRIALVLLLITAYENGIRHAKRETTFDLLDHLQKAEEKT